MTEPPAFSITKSRAQFPALQQSHQVYFDNAGGSQVLSTVSSSYACTPFTNLTQPAHATPLSHPPIEFHHLPYLPYQSTFRPLLTRCDCADTFSFLLFRHRIKSYLEETNVQLGASYNVAKQSTEIHERGLAAAAAFMNAEPDEVGS